MSGLESRRKVARCWSDWFRAWSAVDPAAALPLAACGRRFALPRRRRFESDLIHHAFELSSTDQDRAAALILERPELDIEKITSQTVISELTRIYLSDVQDVETRLALEASAVVRRMNHPMLTYMFPDADANALFGQQVLLAVHSI